MQEQVYDNHVLLYINFSCGIILPVLVLVWKHNGSITVHLSTTLASVPFYESNNMHCIPTSTRATKHTVYQREVHDCIHTRTLQRNPHKYTLVFDNQSRLYPIRMLECSVNFNRGHFKKIMSDTSNPTIMIFANLILIRISSSIIKISSEIGYFSTLRLEYRNLVVK